MDKETIRLLNKHKVTNEVLNKTQVTLQFDMSGRLDFLNEVQSMDIRLNQNNNKNSNLFLEELISRK